MESRPVRLSGQTQFTREQAGTRCVLRHVTEIRINPFAGLIRATDCATGESVSIPITDRGAVYGLHLLDQALMRSARRGQPIESRLKDRDQRPIDPRVPPGFVWCPVCLGDPDLAPLCDTCDGNRIVREDH